MADSDVVQAKFLEVQNLICDEMARADGQPYREDRWRYGKGSGGGITRVWEHSTVLEKGGVNYSGIVGRRCRRRRRRSSRFRRTRRSWRRG